MLISNEKLNLGEIMQNLLRRKVGKILIRVGTPVENNRINDIPSPSNGTHDSALLPGMSANVSEYGNLQI